MSEEKEVTVYIGRGINDKNPRPITVKGNTYSQLKSRMCYGEHSVSVRGSFYIPDKSGTKWEELPFDQMNQPVVYSHVCYKEFVAPPPKSKDYKYNELVKAVEKNLTDEVLKLLSEGADVGDNGDLIFIAVEKDNLIIVSALLKHGLGFMTRMSVFPGEFITHVKVDSPNCRLMTEILLKAGIDYNNTSLRNAIYSRNIYLLEYFLKNSTHKYAKNYREGINEGLMFLVSPNHMGSGETALHCAVRNGDPRIVKMILDSNVVDKTKKNNFGQTAFDVACKLGKIDIADMVKL